MGEFEGAPPSVVQPVKASTPANVAINSFFDVPTNGDALIGQPYQAKIPDTQRCRAQDEGSG